MSGLATRSIRGLLVLLTQILVLAAPAARAEAPDELTIGITQFPSTLHPAIDYMAAKSYVLGMARRPVTAYGADWALGCFLCTHLPTPATGEVVEESRPDGTTGLAVTFTLRPDAAWGDGTPITSRDVVFSWTVGRHPLSGFSSAQSYTKDIVGITPLDDRRYTVHLARKTCQYQAQASFDILPSHLEAPIFADNPDEYRHRTLYNTNPAHPGLWSGPYRVTGVESGSHIVLERNEAWHGPKPFFRRVVVRAIENSAALEANLLSGDVDMIAGEIGLPLDQALALEKRAGARFAFQFKPGLFYEHIDLNLDNPILADRRVRQALLMGLDRETLVKQLFGGRQPVAHNAVSPLDPVFMPDFRHYPFDPAAAARLLDEAGWTGRDGAVRLNAKGERLSLTVMTTAGNRSRELVEQVLQGQWRKLGIDVRIDNQPARVLFGQTLRERRYPAMALYAWLGSPAGIPRSTLHSTMIPTAGNGWSGQNTPGFSTPAMDKALDQLEVTCGDAAKPLWQELEQIYAEELPALPLFYRADAHLLPQWLEGVTPTGHQEPSTLWIESWISHR